MQWRMICFPPTEHSDSECEDDFEQALPQVEQQLEAVAVNATSEGSNGRFGQSERALFGAPENWSPQDAPEEWSPEQPKLPEGEPATFAEVDNPGGWSRFTHRPKFDGK